MVGVIGVDSTACLINHELFERPKITLQLHIIVRHSALLQTTDWIQKCDLILVFSSRVSILILYD